MRFWPRRRSRIPSDLEILDAIYERYRDEFGRLGTPATDRASKIFVPLDLEALAVEFGVDADHIFGRLYYDLDHRFGYTNEDGTKVKFFTPVAGKDRDCINFPYLASVASRLRREDRKYHIATGLAVLSLVVAAVSLAVSLLT